MKKILALTLTLGSIGFAASSAEAKPSISPASAIAAAGVAPQVRLRIGPQRRRRWDRGYRRGLVRVTTQSRFVRVGRHVWRETYQVRYLPNGLTQTRLISRVQVR